MNKNNKFIFVLCTIIIILLMCLFAQHYNKANKSGVLLESEHRENIQNKPISIFGFSEIHMKASNKIQCFKFENPESNTCYMDIKFELPDGAQLFEIKRIEPGYGVCEVQLNKVLKNGDYLNCRFTIKCYSMDDNTELNGASMNVNLYVR